MAITSHYFTKFEPCLFYHIYNRSVDEQPMFRSRENYRFFLQQYCKYLDGLVDTYAYCLLGNHFHLLILTPTRENFEKYKEENQIKAEI